ncbi:MAG: hypothetical protein WD397_16885 [Wenzhouxiangellaceae bacterium]
MTDSEHKEQMIKAMGNADFESAMKHSYAGYVALEDSEKDERIFFLRAIRGSASKLLEDITGDSQDALEKVARCDFCARDLKSHELTQGHSGKICNFCVDIIHNDIHR